MKVLLVMTTLSSWMAQDPVDCPCVEVVGTAAMGWKR